MGDNPFIQIFSSIKYMILLSEGKPRVLAGVAESGGRRVGGQSGFLIGVKIGIFLSLCAIILVDMLRPFPL